MKRTVALLIVMLTVFMSGCTVSIPPVETTSDYGYVYQTTALVTEAAVSEEISSQPDVNIQETVSVEETSLVQQETLPAEAETTTATDAEKTTAEEKTSSEEKTSAEELTGSVQTVTEVDLSIEMPSKNGTIETDLSADNKYIKIVCKEKGLDSALLAAVYSVPDSGQNYVFEFNDVDNFTADNIRRVYLIDSSGTITGITAVDSSERENVSAVENWFCMNVLIKELVFPSVADKLK